MWNAEKFGAVSSRVQQTTLRPSALPRVPLLGRSSAARAITHHCASPTNLFGGAQHAAPGTNAWRTSRNSSRGFRGRLSEFLPGTASQVEFDVSNSKQTAGQFLPGTRIAHKRSSTRPNFAPESVHGTRVTAHGSRLLPATAFRYNAGCPNFSREACNLT
jgi:hypothetical protein